VPGPKIDFLVLADADPRERLRTACRLAEEIYDEGLKVTVRVATTDEATALDELMWTFSDRSFVPHAQWPADQAAGEHAAVLIAGDGSLPATHRDALINLGTNVPPDVSSYGRVLEIVGGSESYKQAGRARWRAYREAGLETQSRNL
jgi:DNA polymerase-3 subunit chi